MKDWLNIEGKTVIVTGGASGIGKAIAQEFLDLQANVVVADMASSGPAEFENLNNYLYVTTDVTDKASIENMVKKTMDKFQSVDILVNNAGINIPRLLVDDKQPLSIFELDENVYNKIMDVNVKGVYLTAQVAGREMVKKGSGVIVNMSSECGLEGSEGQSIYAASKNAVNSLTRSWAKELGKKGVRIVGVAPGIMEATGLRTDSYEEALAYTRGISVDKLRSGYSSTSTTPLGRSGKLKEAADLVCYLASDKASYVHGITINVAGGKTRG